MMEKRVDNIKNIIKSPKDVAHIIKAAIALSSESRVRKAYLRGKVFYLEFDANLEKFAKAGPQVLAAYMLNVMLTCHRYLKDYPVSGVEILCRVGRDGHRIRTPMGILEALYKVTGGKLERITGAIVRRWVMDSVYEKT